MAKKSKKSEIVNKDTQACNSCDHCNSKQGKTSAENRKKNEATDLKVERRIDQYSNCR